MKITEEISITEFKPWCGAVYTRDRIIEEGKADTFDLLIDELYPDGLTSNGLNDLLRFDSDWIYEMLGISEEDEEDEEELGL